MRRYWYLSVLRLVSIGIDRYSCCSVLPLVLVVLLLFIHIFFWSPCSVKIIPPAKALKSAYLPPSLSFLENSQEKSFLGLPMANITPHFCTKEALLSRGIDFQQAWITSFRGSRIGIKCRIFEILQKFLTVETC